MIPGQRFQHLTECTPLIMLTCSYNNVIFIWNCTMYIIELKLSDGHYKLQDRCFKPGNEMSVYLKQTDISWNFPITCSELSIQGKRGGYFWNRTKPIILKGCLG